MTPRHVPKPTRLVPTPLLALFACAIAFLALYAAFSSVLHSRSVYADIPQELRDENAAIVSYVSSPFSPGTSIAFLDADERAHMRDVKGLFTAALAAALLAAGAIAGVAIALRRLGMREQLEELLARGAWWAGWGLLGLAALLGAASLLSFERFWVLFHVFLFPQGGWLFPADSMLIAIYPGEFFAGFVARTLAIASALGALLVGLGLLSDRMREAEKAFKEPPRQRK